MVRHFTTHVIVCKNIKRDGGSTSLSFYNPGDCLPKTQGKKGKYKYSYKPFFSFHFLRDQYRVACDH